MEQAGLASELGEIIESSGTGAYEGAILASGKPEVLRALSRHRKNLISWLPFLKGTDVLEVHPGFGELSEWLAGTAGSLTLVCGGQDSPEVLRRRCRDAKLLSFPEAKESGTYDVILWNHIRPEEYDACLGLAEKHLKADGVLLLSCGNSFGISAMTEYTPGRQEPDSAGVSFTALMDRLSKEHLETKIFYPYPDDVFVHDIYTTAHMPEPGFVFGNRPDYQDTRIQIRDQAAVADLLLAEGVLPHFFDAALIAAARRLPDPIRKTTYVHFSDRRDDAFSTVTLVGQSDGERMVRKCPYTDAAAGHIDRIVTSYEKLSEAYSGSRIRWNRAERTADGAAALEYLSGRTLSEHLDTLLLEQGTDVAADAAGAFFDALRSGQTMVPFAATDAYRRIFSTVPDWEDVSLPVTDIDCIFDNVYLHDGLYEIADYEWTMDFPVPFGFIIYRCLHYFIHYRQSRMDAAEVLCRRFGITQEKQKVYDRMEQEFQAFVNGSGNLMSRPELQKDNFLIENLVERLRLLRDRENCAEREKKSRITLCRGIEGEELPASSYTETAEHGFYTITVPVDSTVTSVRFEPAGVPGILFLQGISDAAGVRPRASFENMKKIGTQTYLCYTANPVIISEAGSGTWQITYRYDVLVTEKNYGRLIGEEEYYLMRVEEEQMLRKYL